MATAKGESSQIGRGEQGPLHNFLIALRSGGEILPESRSNRSVLGSLLFALCGAQRTGCFYPRWRRANTFILSYKDEGERKKKLAKSGVAKLDCEGNTETESSGFLSPTVVSNTTSRSSSARLYLRALLCSALLCALTCTDARGPVFTPAQLLPAGGVGFHQLQTRDITDETFGSRVCRCLFFFFVPGLTVA